MDIQAYFEEWSLKPGDTVRMATSTAHPSVRATLVRLLSGPGTAPAIEGRTADRSDVLDTTFAGRLQATAVGSFATLPLPSPLQGQPGNRPLLDLANRPGPHRCADRMVARRCGARRSQWRYRGPREGRDTCSDRRRHRRANTGIRSALPLMARARRSTSSASTERLSALRDATGPAPVALSADTLTLAAAGVLETGSPRPFNGKIDSPDALSPPRPSAEPLAAWRRGTSGDVAPWAAWRLCQDFADETVVANFRGAPGRIFNGGRAGRDRAQLGWNERLLHRKAGSLLRAAVP